MNNQIESLLKLAGERDQPSAGAVERARVAARQSWQRGLAGLVAAPDRARPRRFMFVWAALASVAAVAILVWSLRPQQMTVDVARVSALQGEARRANVDRIVAVADVLRSGEVLSTGDGRVALAMGDALSLRLDRYTRLSFDAAGQVTLLQGAVYVDSGGLNAHTALRIDTPAGAVRHVGTQFQVRVAGDLTSLQVREGRVVLTQSGGTTLDLAAGDLAEVTGHRVRVERDRPTHGDAWEWSAATAPSFDIENRPLSEFLAWLAREHGWQLRYVDAATQSHMQDIRLHGSMAGLDAHGMLERASLVTGVKLSLSDGALWIGVR